MEGWRGGGERRCTGGGGGRLTADNRPLPSPPGPLDQNEVKCSAFDMEMIFILMQIKLIFTRKVVHLVSF